MQAHMIQGNAYKNESNVFTVKWRQTFVNDCMSECAF